MVSSGSHGLLSKFTAPRISQSLVKALGMF